ncbi:MAG: DUF2852 domain-containing protein [Paracoccaceae bacterium]|jgi:hypothetical protein|uniref:DUF2852 domain-containing protein n=1 Tax=unclassified Seohaeicola TaxID=2641111 RepID=UPI00237B9C74|nr:MULTISPECIES: DUF2852 domain-containing protein [unclassified Seohaeicola]MDD9708582.1 DUF2852 domain-containing protein [Seohaeicola sp. 4SK31]MDD9736696.1 DUF2852 domain-containing protein [Seohaeicola sp. SP36]MDF1709804.1 DUF2852 domain-containing protein [Paracoccaceae bacterium]MDM7971341.1 DUF2852 domain-containing protein [Paracoccaceae bacterium]
MNTTMPYAAPSAQPMGWLSRAEAWLDHKGKGAWIAVMVLGFIFVWPVGLAILAYMIWSKRMFSKSCRNRSMARQGFSVMQSSGNSAFDSYKAETLRRLEEEQHSFEAFLQRLREAKDKAEFDDFMADRARKASAPGADDTSDRDQA